MSSESPAWVRGVLPDCSFLKNRNNLFSSISWKKRLKKKSEAREQFKGHLWGLQKARQGHACEQTFAPPGSCTQPQAGTLEPSFWKLLGISGSLCFGTVVPLLSSIRVSAIPASLVTAAASISHDPRQRRPNAPGTQILSGVHRDPCVRTQRCALRESRGFWTDL